MKIYIDLNTNHIYQIFEIPKGIEKLKPQTEYPVNTNRSYLEFLSIIICFLYESAQVDLEQYKEYFFQISSKIYEHLNDPVTRASLVGGLRDQVSRSNKYYTEEKVILI